MQVNGSALATARFIHAQECLNEAETLICAEKYKGAANRAYYAVFHSMRAVLAFDGFDSKKHSGIIAQFRKEYIKTGVFDIKISDVIEKLFSVRTGSDYDDFYAVSKEECIEQFENAKYMIDVIKKYLDEIIL